MSDTDLQDSSERLNKMLAAHLGIGRRQADELIERRHVQVNGEQARLGQRVSALDSVIVDGQTISSKKAPLVYVLLDKPIGYVSSRAKQGDTPTVYELLPDEYQHLKTVGRLDKDTSGLLLMTNDGDLALQLTHPRFGKQKSYITLLDRPLDPAHQKTITTNGVELADGQSVLGLEEMPGGDRREWRVTMSEGRNRQIRRTFAALGYTVVRLHRIEFGPWSIDQLHGRTFHVLVDNELKEIDHSSAK
ncbi:MAG TPA: pseudouridine synthase [Candidatus Saccharimonadales bacterium]|nr:pseudouridine synthase [Candidatus Saccharimonadales bacterium]